MNQDTIETIKLQKATERFRQERETFDLRKKQEKLWFTLRLLIGYSAILLLAAIVIICSYILLNNQKFPENVINAVQIALFGDILGLVITVWKVALNPQFITKLEPVTKTDREEDDLIDPYDNGDNKKNNKKGKKKKETPKEPEPVEDSKPTITNEKETNNNNDLDNGKGG